MVRIARQPDSGWVRICEGSRYHDRLHRSPEVQAVMDRAAARMRHEVDARLRLLLIPELPPITELGERRVDSINNHR